MKKIKILCYDFQTPGFVLQIVSKNEKSPKTNANKFGTSLLRSMLKIAGISAAVFSICIIWPDGTKAQTLNTGIARALQAAPDQARIILAINGSDWCGTHTRFQLKDPARALALYGCPTMGPPDQRHVRDAYIPTPSTPIKTIRLRIHVLREDYGSYSAATQAAVDAQMRQLNSDFAPARIQFAYSTRFVNSTRFRYLSDYEMDAMKLALAEAPACQHNVYVTALLSGLLGLSTLPWDSDALLATGGTMVDEYFFGVGQKTLTHEIGHALGLWHTHHGVSEVSECSACYEQADGLNGDSAGDFCSDTAPTPVNSYCFSPGGTDPCSGRSWGPTDPQNYMGYAPDSCYSEFSPQQMGRMHGWIKERLSGWLDGSAIGLPEAVDAPELTWVSGGMVGWIGQTGVTHDGVDAGQSGSPGSSQECWMETTVDGPGRLAFWWKVSSEARYDYLRFSDNSVIRASISGSVDWEPKSIELDGGSHTLRWCYSKDSSVDFGLDRGWVDQVQFLAAPVPLRLLPPVRLASGVVRLFVANVNGTPVDPQRNIGILATTNVVLSLTKWSRLDNDFVLTNGMLQMDDPAGAIVPQRYYIAVEEP